MMYPFAAMHSVTDRQTDGQTDRQTTVAYQLLSIILRHHTIG